MGGIIGGVERGVDKWGNEDRAGAATVRPHVGRIKAALGMGSCRGRPFDPLRNGPTPAGVPSPGRRPYGFAGGGGVRPAGTPVRRRCIRSFTSCAETHC